MKSKLPYKIIFVISSVVFIICALLLVRLYLPVDSDMDKYKEETEIIETSSGETTTVPITTLKNNPINFKKLKQTNSDVYAWITIPDTAIDYPVIQSSADKDDLFYLNHDIEGNYFFAGMIFSQKKNKTDFSDPVTVLYGHNMLNGTMFADLHKFEDDSFFNDHREFYIYRPGHILTYTVKSAYTYDNRHILNTFNFSVESDLQEYFDYISNPKSVVSNVHDDVELNLSDKVLTLSTCTNNDQQRYLVQGVLTNDEPTN